MSDPDRPGPIDRIEPGSPSVENALFVALGVALTLGAFVHLVQVFG